ncbi:ATP-binding protein [Natrarchaeobius chitinivorans]|uniref:histidine kinase n=1 Tax=Natrarchaeobius chitinivorans TaxID=1679083 RepID=A0A3N6NCZ5_NATCH|nr:ATP-binding protein [Natrarchaeobius chitinivorans]RQG96642.1 PAS domain S-box protein [Natrarchaeobius chitinivorans]
MTSSSRIICVGTDDRTTETLSIALDEYEVILADDIAVEDATAVECVVVDAGGMAALEKRLSSIGGRDFSSPVVAFANREWSPVVRDLFAAGATDVVRREPTPNDDDVHLLARRVSRAVSESSAYSERETSSGHSEWLETGERLERLRNLGSELGDAESRAVVYDLLVEGADTVFSFDACTIADGDGDRIAVRAARGTDLQLDAEPLEADAGIVGRTIAEGRTITVDDVREVNWARPTVDSYRAVLSVPLGDTAAFQLISTTAAAYDETDTWLAELLCTIAEHAVGRTASKAVLTAERDWFEALFENIPDAAIQYVVDEDTLRIKDANAAFVRLFGYEPNDAVGESVLDLIVPSGVEAPVEASLESARSAERFEEEVRRSTVDGQQPFLLRSVPVSTDGADRRGYLIYTDIRIQKRRERQLQRKNERLDEFASLVSHDLRNPLSIAIGNAELALERESLEPLTIISEELERMERMIEELLSLARQGDVVGDPSPVDLGVAAEEAWTHVQTANARLHVGDLPTVDGDRSRIEELLENCYRNAIEHGGTDVSVTVGPIDRESVGSDASPLGESGGVPSDEIVGFVVEDDGPGFPAGHVDEVLEYGFTTDDDGTGFGLAIVDEIAAAHGWSVVTANGSTGGARLEFQFGGHPAVDPVGSTQEGSR